MDRYGQPTQCQLHGDVSAHMQIIVKKIWHEKSFVLILSAFFSRRTRTSKDIRFQHLRGYFLAVGKNVSLPEKFFSRPLFQAQRKWLKRSCSHACGREEGPKEPRIGPRTGCETCQAGWRMVACLDPSGDIGSRAPASKHNPGSPERIRRHYYLEARGLSLSGQRVGLQARRV